jgi:hypothetical protein
MAMAPAAERKRSRRLRVFFDIAEIIPENEVAAVRFFMRETLCAGPPLPATRNAASYPDMDVIEEKGGPPGPNSPERK